MSNLDVASPLPGVYGESINFVVSLGYLASRVVGILFAIGGWFLSLFNRTPIILTVVILSAGAFLWQNNHDLVGEATEFVMRCTIRPVYVDPIRPLIELVQRIYNPSICWWNAVNWITFGVWREVVFPLAQRCNVTEVFINIGLLIETLANDLVADYVANGNFLTLNNGLFNWGPGSDPYNQPNGQVPGGTGMLCQRWLTLWQSWVDLYCCLCADLCKFLRLQPLFIIFPGIGFSLWPPGLLASDQIGDEQLWRTAGHLFNAAMNIVQQLFAIILYVLAVVIGGSPPNDEFPRPDLRLFVQLGCLAISAFVRSCENAAQLFVECFLPFPFDFRFYLCFVDSAACIILKLAAWIVGILFNADRLGTQCIFPNFQDSAGQCCPTGTGADPMTGVCLGATTAPVEGLWATRFRDEWIEIANRIAPVHIPGFSLPNAPGMGGPIEGVPRLSECISIFLQRLLCDPAQVCFDENAQPTPCTCYGQPIPTGILGDFSLSCIIEASLSLVVDLLTALLDATYYFDNVLTYFLWLDDKWFSYLDIILIDDIVSEDIMGVRQPGIVRCILSIFRSVPTVGRCIENLLVDFAARVIVSFVVFVLKFFTSTLVSNLVFFLIGPLSGDMGPCLIDPPAQDEFNCTPCVAGQTPTAGTPCFPRGWLLTTPRARDDWERIWLPIIIQDSASEDDNRKTAENCFCQILNLIPIPRLPCTNCETCGYIPPTGSFIPCKRSPFEDNDRMCNDPLTGPFPGQGIVRKNVLTRGRDRVKDVMSALKRARASVPNGKSPLALFQAIQRNARAAAHNQRMVSKQDADRMLTQRRKRVMEALHRSHQRESPYKEPLQGWTHNYLRDASDPKADLSGYAPEGFRARRFDHHLVDRSLDDDGVMWGTDPETGHRHMVDERVICESPEGGIPGCFDLCCGFRRLLRAAVRLLIQTGNFFDGIIFGEEMDPKWPYFVGPESNQFLAPFEVELFGLVVEIVEILQCLCNFIELIFPIPFLDLCCPVIAAGELIAEIFLTIIKAIKSLALDNICLNARFVQGTAVDTNGIPVQIKIGDTCPPPAVLDDSNMCCPSIDDVTGLSCTVATTAPGICDPDRDNFSYFTKVLNTPGGLDPALIQTPPVTAYPFPLAWQTGPAVEICDATDPDGNGPQVGEIGVLCDNCCKAGQTQFECDIDRMADQTIVVIVCLCDIIRAMFPIPGLDLCCAVEAIAVTAIEVIRLAIQIVVNLGTINTSGLDYFRIVPGPADPMPGSLDDVGLVVQFDVIFDTLFGVPGGRCAKEVPSTGLPGSTPQFTGGEAVGGAITCVCQILNWIIPARQYPSLPVDTCPLDEPECDNCPLIDLCCWVREPAFFLNGLGKFLIRFLTTFWQEWIDGQPLVVIQFLFCDEYNEWDPTMGDNVPSGNIWPASDNNVGTQPSELTQPTCAKLDPILRSLQAIISDCPCTILRYVDALIALVFAEDPSVTEDYCLCGPNGLFRTLPELVYFTVRRLIQFLRMFWSKDFWSSPDGPPIISAGVVNGDPVPGPVLLLNDVDCASLDPPPSVPPGYSGRCLVLQDGTIVFAEDYQNQTWARWFLMPIATKLCQAVLSLICIPDKIFGAIFGCSNTRAQLVAGLVIWPTEALIVALEFIEGIANTFAGNCGGIQYGGGDAGTGPLGSVNTACIGGALTGILKFPINLLIADGELANCPPGSLTDFLRGLLLELPTCDDPRVQRVSGLLISTLRYMACLLNRFTSGPSQSDTIDSAAGKAVLALAGFLSVLWQLSSKLLNVFAAFLNLVISIIGFSTGDLCSCHEPWPEWYTPESPLFVGTVNPNSPPRWRQGEVFGAGLCYPCMIDAAIDCGTLSGNVFGTYYDPITDTVTPGPVGCPAPFYFPATGCGQCVDWVERPDLGLPPGVFRPPDGYGPNAQYRCHWEQPADRARVLCSFLGIIEGFFAFIGAIFNIFDPPPKFPPETIVSASRRRQPNAPEGSPEHAHENARRWAENNARGEEPDEAEQAVFRSRHFHKRAKIQRERRNAYTANDTVTMLAEAFVGYDTSDCGVDPVSCLCREVAPIMEGLCSYDYDKMQVISHKPGNTVVTADEVIARLGQACEEGKSPCDQLLTGCGKEPWHHLANNPALRHAWVQCIDTYVAGERIHAVDERFPADFFNSHTGILDLIKNVHGSAQEFGKRMRKEAEEHHEKKQQRQRKANPGGLTDEEYDRLYLKRALFTYTQEHGAPRFPGIAASMLRLDLKLHKMRTGHFGRLLRTAAKNVATGNWEIPMHTAWTDFRAATGDLGHFVFRGIDYRAGVAQGIRHVADTFTEVDQGVRRTVRHIVNHGITGERGLISHWRRDYHRKRYGTEKPHTYQEALDRFWDYFGTDPLVRAFGDGPAVKWWNSSWRRNLNPFKPFYDHIQRVRRVYRNTPEHLLHEKNPAAATTPSRLYQQWKNPWTEFKKALRRRWMPRWDWRMHDWPAEKETPDRWRNAQTIAGIGIAGYEVVYPNSVPVDVKKKWVIGPGSDCDLIANTLALVMETFDYCATEYTFNLPPPDCQNITIVGNMTIIEPLPDIGCARRRDVNEHHFRVEAEHHNVMPVHGNGTLARYLRRSARHRKGFLRDRTHEWHKHGSQTKMVWERTNPKDKHSYVRPKIVHTPDPSKARRRIKDLHPHYWKRVTAFVLAPGNFFTAFFCWLEDLILEIPISPDIADFIAMVREWIENDNLNPDDCGMPGAAGVGLKYWLLFSARCEWPEYVNCSNPCALGLKEALRRITIVSLIVFGGVSILFPTVLLPLVTFGGFLFYVIVVPAAAWHYSPQCWFIFPSIPIPGIGISVPILPFPIGLPVLPECLVDEIKAFADELFGPCPFENFRGIVPLCLYNGNPCPACPERIDLANCVIVGVADGISNIVYLLWWISPDTLSFITGTLGQTCFGNGCLFDFFPFNVQYIIDKVAEFEVASDTQQCRQQWCFWATLPSVGLPLLFLGIGGGFVALILVLLLDVIIGLIAVIFASPVRAFFPGNAGVWVEAPGDEEFEDFGDFDDALPMGSPFVTYRQTRRTTGYFDDEEERRRRRRAERDARTRARYAQVNQQVNVGSFMAEWMRPAMNFVRRRVEVKQKKE